MSTPDEWQERMRFIVQTMREMSLQVDPQAMVRAYGARMRQIMPADRWISLSRRDLESPQYRITRSSTWAEEVNPWKEKDAAARPRGGPPRRADLRRRAPAHRRPPGRRRTTPRSSTWPASAR